MPDLLTSDTAAVLALHEIVLYDGTCGFCDVTVNKVIRNDHKDRYRFASLQSETGRALRKKYGIPDATDSLVLVTKEGAYIKSNAVLRIFAALGGGWNLLKPLLWVPGLIRDGVYDFIAARRHRIIKQRVCMLPTPEVRKKYLL
jgi:predicted DCC family thiol-disulfide oxidoreductase YuxK